MVKKILVLATALVLVFGSGFAQTTKDTIGSKKPQVEKKWFDAISIRGYVQARYNRLLETNSKLKCEQCDKGWGENGGFFLRRTRIIFFGQITKQVYFYIQPDFASAASSSSLNFAQIRDAYFDIGIDKKNEFRFRIGQSKIPFGFGNMQSSQNRLTLDRDDAINSAASNERDMGAFFYWAPENKRKLLSSLVKDGLKGSGDYGIIGLGIFNGQTANKPELNNSSHYIARVTYPFELKGQIIEAGVQAYSGKFVVPKDQINTGVKFVADRNFIDQRVAGTFVLYPKPFGIQAEYTIGKGPEFNKLTDSIEVKNLKGGYVTLSYFLKHNEHVIIPFTRFQYYRGGKKFEQDARSYEVDELEIGIEWQPVRQFEFTAMYTMSSRKFEDFATKDNLQKGNLLRLQAQINF
jgi:phosphate-selective porin